MAQVDEEYRRPIIPNRKDRRRLDGEKLLGMPPILPIPGEVKHTVILADGTKVCGWNFQVSPWVLEMDSILESDIGIRLIYSTILPYDERRFIGSCNIPKNSKGLKGNYLGGKKGI